MGNYPDTANKTRLAPKRRLGGRCFLFSFAVSFLYQFIVCANSLICPVILNAQHDIFFHVVPLPRITLYSFVHSLSCVSFDTFRFHVFIFIFTKNISFLARLHRLHRHASIEERPRIQGPCWRGR